VAAFLQDKVSFLGMADVVAESLSRVPYLASPTLADYAATDAEARRVATSLLAQ
jgi:1-deoxy-D-xylulose-5-phosphate reductoisomerase